MELTVDEVKANVAAFRRKEKAKDLATVNAALRDLTAVTTRLAKRGFNAEAQLLMAPILMLVQRRCELHQELVSMEANSC